MSQSVSDPEERKINVESKATMLFFFFILIEGYLILASTNGFYPFYVNIDYQIIIDDIIIFYAMYWIGIFCLILGIFLAKYNKILPPLALIGSIIFFILFVL